MHTFIIVDDEKLIRQGTLKKLSGMPDITCLGEAENGRECITLVEQQQPDIVILDMQMPVMDGTQLLSYLSAHYPDMPLIVISGFKDFDYVKHAIDAQAIDYILKPFNREAICQAMQNAIAKLDSRTLVENKLLSTAAQKETACYEYDVQMLKNLILGYHTDSTTLTSQKLSYINHNYNLVLITFYFQTPEAPSCQLDHFLSENGFGDLALYLTHTDRKQIGFIILFLPETPSEDPQQIIRQVADASTSWLSQQGTPAIAGISSIHPQLQDLHAAFLECSYALNECSLNQKPIRPFLCYTQERSPRFIAWEQQEEFLFRVETGMEEAVVALNQSLFDYYLHLPDLTLGDVKFHCAYLSGLCRNLINYYFKQDISSDSASMQNIVSSIFSLDELRQYYRNFFVNICRMLRDQNVYAGDDVIEKLKIYVDRNYQKELSLEFLSSLFYMNRSYLSHLFRQKTDCKFVDYVNQIRVEKAKDLLLQSDRKMYQIARAVGYDNIKYFFRIFKKVTGMTPSQFQEAHGIAPAPLEG